MTEQEIKSLLETTSPQDVKNLVEYLKIQHAENEAVAKGKTQKDIVRIFLDERRKSNLKLAQKYPENAMGKSFDDCWAYIEDNAKKAANGQNRVAITSFTVFDWAVNYFCDDTIQKFATAKPKTTKTPTSTKKAPEKDLQTALKELQQAKEAWQKSNDEKVAKWEIENNQAIDKFDKEHAMDLFPPENPYRAKENPHLSAVFPEQNELDKVLAAIQNPTPVETEETTEENDEEIEE